MAEVAEVAARLSHQFPVDLVEATIWSSSRFLVIFLWACCHLMLHLWCPHLSQIRFCLNQRPSSLPFPSRRLRRSLVQHLMPLRFQNPYESNFTGIYEPWNWYWLGPPKPVSR